MPLHPFISRNEERARERERNRLFQTTWLKCFVTISTFSFLHAHNNSGNNKVIYFISNYKHAEFVLEHISIGHLLNLSKKLSHPVTSFFFFSLSKTRISYSFLDNLQILSFPSVLGGQLVSILNFTVCLL